MLTKKSRGFEEVGSAFFVLGVAWIANDEVHGEDFRVKGEIVVQLRGEKSLVGFACAEGLILDIVDDDGGVVVDLVEDRFIKVHCDDGYYYFRVSRMPPARSSCSKRMQDVGSYLVILLTKVFCKCDLRDC